MTIFRHIAVSVAGAVRIARFDVDGGGPWLTYTVAGFWLSFAAIVLAVPLDMATDIAAEALAARDGREFRADVAGVVGSVRLVTVWLLHILAIYFAAKFLGLDRGFLPYVIAENWTSLVLMVAQLALVVALTPFPMEMRPLLGVAFYVYLLTVEYVLLRRFLGADLGQAIALLILGILITLGGGEVVTRALTG